MEQLAPRYVYLVWLEAFQGEEPTAARIAKRGNLVQGELHLVQTAQQGSIRARLRRSARTVLLLMVT